MHTDRLTGLLIRFVDAGNTFKGLLADGIHPAPHRLRLLKAGRQLRRHRMGSLVISRIGITH
jgi:hypothetical protein|tara:strand:- start:225 stop:410 length:186 start_codon:yes stop_codon:yes gene_type:complete